MLSPTLVALHAGTLLLIVEINSAVLEATMTRNVILTHVLFRHGARTPLRSYPTDPYREYWISQGFKRITNTGKQQLQKLGGFIRQRYSGFLNSSYEESEVLVNSTDTDRTLMSAYCVLAGLYPPAGEQVWNDSIIWQPIPVHTKPLLDDYLLFDGPFCPRYFVEKKAIMASPRAKAIDEENKDLFDLVAKNSGISVKHFGHVTNVWEVNFIEKLHNMTTADWIDPIFNQLKNLSNLRFGLSYSTLKSQRITGGPLLGHMIENMQARISGSNMNRKAFLFASHDYFITSFLMALKIFSYEIPPFACAVFVELLETSPGTYAVEIYYRNDSSVDPYMLIIPNCSSPCPFYEFVELTSSIIPDDILEECGAKPNSIEQLSYALAILLICETFLMILCFVLCIVCWKRHRSVEFKYTHLRND